jgi:hypothetical protein
MSKVKYPEVAVISVATHGLIRIPHKKASDIYDKNDMPMFDIPTGIAVTKYSEIPPGTCNMMTDWKLKEYIDEVVSPVINEKTFTQNNEEILRIVSNLSADFKKRKKEIVKLEVIEHSTARKTGEIDGIIQKYVYTEDSGYLVSQFRPGTTMLNKTYTRDNTEAHDTYDWQIIVLNMTGQPDLVRELVGSAHYGDTEYITTEMIVNFLKSKGVKHVIFLDFSCSNFVNANFDIEKDASPTSNPFDIDITNHNIVPLRREMIANSLFGGKKRKTKRTRRRNKTKKRTKR